MAGKKNNTHATPWSQKERRRVKERFRASLAGLVELEALRCKHRKLVETALEDNLLTPQISVWMATSAPDKVESKEIWINWVWKNPGDRKLAHSLSHDALSNSWNTRQPRAYSRSTDDLLLFHNHNYWSTTDLMQENSRSMTSSGFYQNKEYVTSSCSKSCTSLPSWTSHLHQTLHLYEGAVLLTPELEVIPTSGLLSIAKLCPDSHWQDISLVLQYLVVLEPRYRVDLVSGQSSEVYRYPSPLHAVALQSPIYSIAWDLVTADKYPQDTNHHLVKLNGAWPDALRYSECHVNYCSLPFKLSSRCTSGTVFNLCRPDQVILRLVRKYHHQASATTMAKQHLKNISRQKSLSLVPLTHSTDRRTQIAQLLSTCSQAQVNPGSPVTGSARWSCAFVGNTYRGNACTSSASVGCNRSSERASHRLGTSISLKKLKRRCVTVASMQCSSPCGCEFCKSDLCISQQQEVRTSKEKPPHNRCDVISSCLPAGLCVSATNSFPDNFVLRQPQLVPAHSNTSTLSSDM